jgi:phospho-N-acetylmuramoyl-pentapeptide-transferase
MNLGVVLDLVTFVVSTAVGVVLYPFMIRSLRRLGAGQPIQAELPPEHHLKAGTPTGGGILFILLGVLGGVLAAQAGHAGSLPAVAGLVLGGAIGLADDLRKLKVGRIGIPARLKLPLQILLAVPVAWLAAGPDPGHQLLIAFDLGWVYWPLAVLAIVATANAVNLTDGIDGLCGSVSVIGLGGLVLLLPNARAGERAVGLILGGGLVAFLVFNRNPAKVFMGDTGALGLGFALAAMALQQKALLLLPILGIVFVLVTLSVIIQVGYFKLSGGRRIFRMTPIQFTFQLAGWPENRIVALFSAVAVIGVLAAVTLVRAFA